MFGSISLLTCVENYAGFGYDGAAWCVEKTPGSTLPDMPDDPNGFEPFGLFDSPDS